MWPFLIAMDIYQKLIENLPANLRFKYEVANKFSHKIIKNKWCHCQFDYYNSQRICESFFCIATCFHIRLTTKIHSKHEEEKTKTSLHFFVISSLNVLHFFYVFCILLKKKNHFANISITEHCQTLLDDTKYSKYY